MGRTFLALLLSASILVLAGCHTMTFEISNPPLEDEVTERKSFFFWGLTPEMRINVRDKCPYGAAAITEETTFVNGLAGLFTLGIWSPRQTTYHCETAK